MATTSSLLGMGPGSDPSSLLAGLQTFGTVLGISGALLSAIGSYRAAESQRYQLESQALELELQGSLANLNARAAEQDAEAILEAGAREKGRTTLRFGQVKGAARARAAAAGIQAGVGSAAEVQVSIEAAKEIDSLTIERNAVRAAGAARLRGVNLRSQALLSRVGVQNLRRGARSLSPGLAAATSLTGSAATVTGQILQQNRFESLLGRRRNS